MAYKRKEVGCAAEHIATLKPLMDELLLLRQQRAALLRPEKKRLVEKVADHSVEIAALIEYQSIQYGKVICKVEEECYKAFDSLKYCDLRNNNCELACGAYIHSLIQGKIPAMLWEISFNDAHPDEGPRLREIVNFLENVAKFSPRNEVLLRLTTHGRVDTNYGRASEHLRRLRRSGMALHICVEEHVIGSGLLMLSEAETVSIEPNAFIQETIVENPLLGARLNSQDAISRGMAHYELHAEEHLQQIKIRMPPGAKVFKVRLPRPWRLGTSTTFSHFFSQRVLIEVVVQFALSAHRSWRLIVYSVQEACNQGLSWVFRRVSSLVAFVPMLEGTEFRALAM
jgi:hypothetical protein